MLSDGNKTDGNTLEIFLTPYQYSKLSLMPIASILESGQISSLGGTLQHESTEHDILT